MYSNIMSSNELLENANCIIGSEIDNHPQRLRIISSKKHSLPFYNGKEKSVFHLISGEIEIRNIQNDLIIVNVDAPAILGLSSMSSDEDCYYIHTVTNVELTSIPLSEFIDMADHKSLWRHISVILSFYINIYYLRDMMLSQASVYTIIKNHLEIMWSLKKDKLEEISVFDFILNRTPVSRSSLNKVLKDLSAGGYIEIKRGRLVSMNKLPSGY